MNQSQSLSISDIYELTGLNYVSLKKLLPRYAGFGIISRHGARYGRVVFYSYRITDSGMKLLWKYREGFARRRDLKWIQLPIDGIVEYLSRRRAHYG